MSLNKFTNQNSLPLTFLANSIVQVTQSMTFNDAATACFTVTLTLAKMNSLVSFVFPSALSFADAAGVPGRVLTATTTIPSGYRPVANVAFFVFTRVNVTDYVGLLTVASTGTVTLALDQLSPTAWGATLNNFFGASGSYSIA